MADAATLTDAIALVREYARPLPPAEVGLDESPGHTLAADVVSDIDLPPFDNSAMDGFAVRAADTVDASPQTPARLRLTGESRAGTPAEGELAAGCAMRISTGAVMPAGADAVLRVEDSELDDATLIVQAPLEPGKDVRPAGDDIAHGQTVLEAGMRIGVGELTMLAAVGSAGVTVRRPPRVAVLVTGDELVPVGQPLGPGQIHDSNSYMLGRLVREAGAQVVAVQLRVPDSHDAVRAAVDGALDDADVVVASGGVSKGEHDHVKPALREAGVTELFWQAALRPGHPTWFGVLDLDDAARTLVFGLPGNPVSAFVTFHLFVRPALDALVAARRPPLTVTARYRGPRRHKRTGFTHALRCKLHDEDGQLIAELVSANQRSHAISSIVAADGLALVGPESDGLEDGDPVTVRLLRI